MCKGYKKVSLELSRIERMKPMPKIATLFSADKDSEKLFTVNLFSGKSVQIETLLSNKTSIYYL